MVLGDDAWVQADLEGTEYGEDYRTPKEEDEEPADLGSGAATVVEQPHTPLTDSQLWGIE